MKSQDKLLHALLDGERLECGASSLKDSDAERFSLYRQRLELLEKHREEAPDDFVDRLMAALPDKPRLTWPERLRSLWPEGRRWILPAVAGALVTLIIMLGVTFVEYAPGPRLVAVTFEVYAPRVEKIELVGTFSDWMQSGVALKGPDAVGYWGCRVELPAGRYEYLFLVDGDSLVRGLDEGFHRPDGFAYENNVLLLRPEMLQRFVQVHIPASQSGVLIPKELRGKRALIFPKEQGGQWRAILNDGVSAGFQEITLEKALAGLATSGFTSEEARTVLSPLFQKVHSDIHTRHVLLKLQEGVLKGAPLEKLRSAIHNRHQLFNKAKDLLIQTGYEEAMEEAPTLLVSTAMAMESGLHPLFLEEVLSAGRDRRLDRIKAVVEAGESLHHAGLVQEQLRLLMKDCISKELQWEEMERVEEHVKGRLKEGLESKAILDELWNFSGSGST